MSLRVWLPLTRDANNQGLSNITTEIHGPTSSVYGKIGSCYEFDGSNDYISLDGEELYSIIRGGAHPMSFAFWVYHNDSTRGIIFGDYQLSGRHIDFNIELASDHTIRFYWHNAPSKIFSGSEVALQGWTHIAITYDGTKVLIYKNGTLLSDVYQGVLKETTKVSGVYYLGRDSRTGTTALNGRLNDFRIYDHALSAKEIHILSQGLVLHYPLSREGFGSENILKGNYSCITTSSSHVVKGSATIPNGEAIIKANQGKTLWFSFDYSAEGARNNNTGRIGNTTLAARYGSHLSFVYIDTSDVKHTLYPCTSFLNKTDTGHAVQSWVIPSDVQSVSSFSVALQPFAGPADGNDATWYLKNFKIEIGDKPTPWVPHKEDSLYGQLGLDDNVVSDVSGYKHNGTLHNITYSTDTPKYNLCSEFISANTSYVKCNDSDWMVDKATDITINFWAYMTDWTAQDNIHLFSCTETGGFNTEKGSSGYIRFPCNVYTDNAGTKAYKYTNTFLKLSDLSAGFHMFTFIYNTTGQKLYIDGELYNDYPLTSYGLHFNKNARLFLGCEANTANPSAPYTDIKMSDFRIYATTLSPESILGLYNAPISLANTGALLTSGEFEEG